MSLSTPPLPAFLAPSTPLELPTLPSPHASLGPPLFLLPQFISTSIKLQESLAAKLAAAGKTVVPPPAVSWFTGGMPHPLAWNQQSSAGLSEMTIVDMVEVAKQVGEETCVCVCVCVCACMCVCMLHSSA